MMHLCVNLGEYNKLPKHYQNILFHACEAANAWMIGKYDAVNAPALRRLVAAGTQLRPFSQPIMEASLRAANEYYAEIAGRNELFKRTHDSYMAFRGEALLWWQVGELSFDAFMARSRGRS